MQIKVTTAQKAYETIRSKILVFDLLPDERLNEVNLAEDLKISRTPLREALNRLVAEGMLVSNGRGFSVPGIDPTTVRNLFEARIEVESAIVRLAGERASDEELAKLAAFVDESAARSPDVSVDQLVDLDLQFHETIARLTKNPELLRILKNLNDRIHLIRWIKMEGKRDITQAEHRQIMNFLRARDVKAAEQLMRAHILHRNEEILAAVKQAYAHVHTFHFLDDSA